MYLTVLFSSLGIASLQLIKHLPSWWLLSAALSVLVILFCWQKSRRGLFLLLLAFILSFSMVIWRAEKILAWQLPQHFIGKDVQIIGKVITVPQQKSHAIRFIFQTSIIANRKISTKLRLSWYNPRPKIYPGDSWRLWVRLRPPVGLHNPGEFDYARWLFAHAIRATGYVRGIKQNNRVSKLSHFSLLKLRENIANFIAQSVKDPAMQSVLTALTVGSRANMQAKTWQVFQQTGTSHLMAISGLHVGLVAAIAFFLSGLLWWFYPRLCLTIPKTHAASLAAMLAAWCYGLLAGFSLPTQRAVIMITVLALTQCLRREVSIMRRLLIAWWVIILLQPFALFSVSLWLSFVAVFLISFVLSARKATDCKFKTTLRVQAAITLGLLPFSLYFFQQVSVVGLLANLLAIPWVSFVIVPLCLLAVISMLFVKLLAAKLFVFTAQLMHLLWLYLNWLLNWHAAVWHMAIPHLWVFILVLAGVLLLLMPKAVPGRWLGVVGVLPLFYYVPARPEKNTLWLTMLDVGQGLSILVQTKSHVLLYDAGPKSYSGFDAGHFIVVPMLRQLKINTLDMMIVSHGDSDHMGGADAVGKNIFIKQILTSIPQKITTQKAYPCLQGQNWTWDGVQFTMLNPVKGQRYVDNDSSCVLQIKIKGKSVLLTGDMSASVEARLIKQYGKKLHSSVLIVPHHGSNTSSSAAFIKVVKPQYGLISLGAYNRFHFPASKVIMRYRSQHVKILTTAKAGAIQVYLNQNQLKISHWADQNIWDE